MFRQRHNTLHRRDEAGFTLVVALLLLVALTLIGIAGLRNVTLQERMSGNLYFRSLVYNEAVGSLSYASRAAQTLLGSVTSTLPACSATDGRNLCGLDDGGSVSFWSNATAWNNAVSVVTPGNTGVNAQWVGERVNTDEQFSDVACEVARSEANSNGKTNPCFGNFMRFTSRGTDTSTGAVAITQQYYRIPGSINDAK